MSCRCNHWINIRSWQIALNMVFGLRANGSWSFGFSGGSYGSNVCVAN